VRRLLAVFCGLLLPVVLIAPARAADGYAPLDRPGPALSVPHAALAAALVCSGALRRSPLEPVLLNPATGVTAAQNYSWNYERAFAAEGRPWCAVTMPHSTLIDIQTSGEYLVYAIRHMYAQAGRRIAVLGHSQGGMSMRWALRFWPDTRAMVDDVIGMAGSNHGTTVHDLCIVGVTRCVPAVWQQHAGSNFVAALNSRAETFAGISYTEIYTHTDEVVQPNGSNGMPSSSALSTGHGRITNVATQDVCPGDVDEHLLVGTVDPVAYALVADALDHRGPAHPARIDASVCGQLYQPGVDPTNAQNLIQAFLGLPGLTAVVTPDVNLVGAPEVPAEPRLRCYVFTSGC
jgi:lipase (class 2)